MSAFMPPAPPPPTPPTLTVPVPVAYGVGGAAASEDAAGRGSYGPVIAMLAVVAVLAAAALEVGRLCFGRRALGQAGAGGRDLEARVERTCSPCVGAAMLTQEKEAGGGGSAAEAEPPPEGTERGEITSVAS
ncbi:uncharacterized protein C2845_PM07G30990 [Panicum miliaceum]|uniref:Uncharacterized protein n=1 Tax=Panicum miliaceum TaxID=4540 RepID=A0A3L6SHD4_PANMI|nr:uncharacterized protein C2845_PM07G30990 [Panicum miliaceum]